MRLLLALLMLFSTTSFAAPEAARKIALPATQQAFEITLPANASTGYLWFLEKIDKRFLTLIKSNYESPKTKMVGTAGVAHFYFTVKKTQQLPTKTTLIFKYKRPWEKKGDFRLEKVDVYFLKKKNPVY